MEWATTHRRQSGPSPWATQMTSSTRNSSWLSSGHGCIVNPRRLATASASTLPRSPSFRRNSTAFRCARFIDPPAAAVAPART